MGTPQRSYSKSPLQNEDRAICHRKPSNIQRSPIPDPSEMGNSRKRWLEKQQDRENDAGSLRELNEKICLFSVDYSSTHDRSSAVLRCQRRRGNQAITRPAFIGSGARIERVTRLWFPVLVLVMRKLECETLRAGPWRRKPYAFSYRSTCSSKAAFGERGRWGIGSKSVPEWKIPKGQD